MTSTQAVTNRRQGPIQFAIVGAGWRAGFFLHAAEQLPDRFEVTSVLSRDPERGHRLERRWGVRTVRTVPELLRKSDPGFVVVSVTRDSPPL
jgi:predicted dehydrogenase